MLELINKQLDDISKLIDKKLEAANELYLNTASKEELISLKSDLSELLKKHETLQNQYDKIDASISSNKKAHRVSDRAMFADAVFKNSKF